MTTIAYRDGIMAADTWSADDNGIYYGRTVKLHRLPNGAVIGCSGKVSAADQVVRWLSEEGGAPEIKEGDFGALLCDTDGNLFCMHHDLHLSPIDDDPFMAVGSGRELAMGALAMGASAVDAVRIACRYDNRSREPVRSMNVFDKS